ncbi:MAG: GAF domain-containing protein, partial [Gammaproteobacteria bacterium]|nr:GAF domain-containing protein [Gammaproteobacteria bacterium]
SLARTLDRVMEVVRHAARELTGADGATFILRDGDLCFYADEDAVSPLWKGRRFPMSTCISGWTMLNRKPAIIEDIYSDPRIPQDAYRPTFVKSLAMVPIRTVDPIGAIGNYWAERHLPSEENIRLLQALADSTSIALENVQLYADLERRVRLRTEELEAANEELKAFSYSVSHDLRAPLRAIDGFSAALAETVDGTADAEARKYLERIREAAQRMGSLIEDLLELSRITQAPITSRAVDLSELAHAVAQALRSRDLGRYCAVQIADGMSVQGEPGLLRVLLENLIGNAWKFTAGKEGARIEVGFSEEGGDRVYFVRDNGAGFDMAYAGKLFVPFQRLHSQQEFPGTGIGLAIVQRIVRRHGGRIRAEAQVGAGATFYWTLEGGDAVTVSAPAPSP